MPWLQSAYGASSAALAVAIGLAHLSGMRNGQPIRVSVAEIARMWGMSPDAARRGLQGLEKAGFVQVERPPGQKLLVHLVGAYPRVCPVEEAIEGKDEGKDDHGRTHLELFRGAGEGDTVPAPPGTASR